ncbi:MAG: hypothetical protein ACR2F6_09770 [Mycobacteriales bacterium]
MTGRIGTAEARADEVTGVAEVGVGGAGDRADLPGRDRLRVGAVLCDADRDGTEPTEEDGGPADDSRADDLCSADFTEPCDPQPATRSAPAKTAAHRRTARCITTSGYAALTQLPEDHTPAAPGRATEPPRPVHDSSPASRSARDTQPAGIDCGAPEIA